MHVLELVRWEKGRIKKKKKREERGIKSEVGRLRAFYALIMMTKRRDQSKQQLSAQAPVIPRVLSADTHLLVPY